MMKTFGRLMRELRLPLTTPQDLVFCNPDSTNEIYFMAWLRAFLCALR